MDRLSCNQEDIVGFLKRISSSDVKMFTLSEDEISPLHVGLKSRMNALILKDLADKTRRNQGGRDDAEKSCGGNSYGYAPRLGIDLLEDTARHRLRSAKFVSSRSDLQRLAHLSFGVARNWIFRRRNGNPNFYSAMTWRISPYLHRHHGFRSGRDLVHHKAAHRPQAIPLIRLDRKAK